MGINVENILKTADAIEQHSIPDLGFNMGVFKSKAETDTGYPCHIDLTGRGCGTVACIAGWAESLWAHEGKPLALYHGSQHFFGMEGRDDDHALLLMPEGWARSPEQYTPARAVAVLRHLAATGEVDWTISSPEAA